MKYYSILIFLCIAYTSARSPSSLNLDIENRTFTQIVDHFDHSSKEGTYKQRFWYSPDFYDPEAGHVFIYICGESLGAFPSGRSWALQLAKEFSGLFFSIEHRYYGESQPMSDWTMDGLKFLNHEQALADAAYFVESANLWIQHNYSTPDITPKWIVLGGSYAGALSAWMRYKYPHLIIGSIASSGVVQSIENFYQYEIQVEEDLYKSGSGCFNITRDYSKYCVEQMTKSDSTATAFKKLFGAEALGIDDFMYYFADIYVGYVQYGRRREYCDKMYALNDSRVNMTEQMKKFALFGREAGTSPESYGFGVLTNTTINPIHSSRQWTYQFCTTFGWFQTPNPPHILRWKMMNTQYWLNYCKKAFGVDLVPDWKHNNELFGGVDIARVTSNTLFVQGGDDPWQWAGVRENPGNPLIDVEIVKCDDCGHCCDLYPPKDDDPVQLKATRVRERAAIGKWLHALKGITKI